MRTFLMTSVVVSLCSCSESSGSRAKEQLDALQKKKGKGSRDQRSE